MGQLTDFEREILNRVLVTHRRPDIDENSPVAAIILATVDTVHREESTKRYPFNTRYNYTPKEYFDSPADAWHKAAKLRDILTIEDTDHSYWRLENRIEATSGDTFQTVYDMRAGAYVKDLTIWRAVEYVPLEFTPPVVQQYVVAAAAARYLAGQDGDAVTLKQVQQDAAEARQQLVSYKINSQTVSDRQSPLMRGYFGRRGRLGL